MSNFEAKQFSDAEIEKLLVDPQVTQLAGAGIECRFIPQLSFLDRRGEILSCLEEVFPSDGQKPEIEYGTGENLVEVKDQRIKTTNFVAIDRAGVHRERMVPGTLPHFGNIARTHLKLYQKLFPSMSILSRFGYRVLQSNVLDESKVKRFQKNFADEFLGGDSLAKKLRKHSVEVVNEQTVTVYALKESYLREGKVFDYTIRFLVGIGDSEAANRNLRLKLSSLSPNLNYLYTDLDFSLSSDKSDKEITFEDAIRLTRRVDERAAEIHAVILGLVINEKV
jgi:hypothetical protein